MEVFFFFFLSPSLSLYVPRGKPEKKNTEEDGDKRKIKKMTKMKKKR
jgi:hypothetical protein